ncbi:squalene/phytoene synthase family protein [bacterium]|nr:squalene/phytoene synthase family protein [bacterium]MBU1652116.1 squalene/phytoene synthase family protein [bacterium]
MIDLKLRSAQLHCIKTALTHYENFFVLGPLTPIGKLPHVAALYAFSRHSDDLADEIVDETEAAAQLNQWQDSFQDSLNGQVDHKILRALKATIERHNLPTDLLIDLLSAFRQDLSVNRFDTFEDVRNYTRRSADPVGRLVLRLYGFDDPELDELSDHICTGLQLANFCQDIGDDAQRNRIYIPLDECKSFDVDPIEIMDCTPSARLERLLHYQNVRAYKYLTAGLPLAEKLKGRLKVTVRLFALGGLQVLENLRRDPQAALYRRVSVSSKQKLNMLVSSLKRPDYSPSLDAVK